MIKQHNRPPIKGEEGYGLYQYLKGENEESNPLHGAINEAHKNGYIEGKNEGKRLVNKAIDYLSRQIDGDSPTWDATVSEAIRILQGNEF